MTYSKSYCEEKGISTSELNESQRTLYYIAENMKMDNSISEEGYKHFQTAIKSLEQKPFEKFDSVRQHIYKLAGDYKCWDNRLTCEESLELCHILDQTSWIPIKTRPMTEEEKEEIGHEYDYMYDCPLPDNGQDVLITDCYGNVEIDTFYADCDGSYFETNCDDGEVIAWMPFPEPYKAESEVKE